MLTVERRDTRSVDWVARFELSSFNRIGSPLRIISDELDESSLQRASGGGVVVLFDGLLYDRRELADALDVSRGLDDAGLILHAWSRWGSDFVHHIRGPFAVVVWDGDARRLIAARDPFGEQPLFFAEDGSSLLLSASIDALLACPGVSRALNRAALADHLCQRWPDAAERFLRPSGGFDLDTCLFQQHAASSNSAIGSRFRLIIPWKKSPPNRSTSSTRDSSGRSSASWITARPVFC